MNGSYEEEYIQWLSSLKEGSRVRISSPNSATRGLSVIARVEVSEKDYVSLRSSCGMSRRFSRVDGRELGKTTSCFMILKP